MSTDERWSEFPIVTTLPDASFIALLDLTQPVDDQNQIITSLNAKAYFQTPLLNQVDADNNSIINLGSISFDDLDTSITQSSLDLLLDVADGGEHVLRIDDVVEYSFAATTADFIGNDIDNVGTINTDTVEIDNQGGGADPTLTSNSTNQDLELTGNLLIGISSSDDTPLDVRASTAGSGAKIAAFGGSTAQRIEFFDEDTGAVLGPKIFFDAGNVAQITGGGDIALLPLGNVGIGITTPSSPLHVFENNTETGSAGGLTLENAGTGDSLLHFFLSVATAVNWTIGVDNTDDSFKIAPSTDLTTNTALTIDTSGNITIGNITVDQITFDNASTGGNPILLSNSTNQDLSLTGNLGIGTLDPRNVLHVDVNDSSGIPAGTLLRGILITQTGTPEFIIENSTTGDVLRLNVDQAAKARFQSLSADGTTIDENDMLVFNLDTGQVGIGTDSPVSLLHVFESTASVDEITGLTIENAGTGDSLLHFLQSTSGSVYWTMGIDHDISDKFIITNNVGPITDNFFTILTDGKIGMGVATPTTPLHIRENSSDTVFAGLTIEQDGVGDSVLHFDITAGDWAIGIDNSDGDLFKISNAVDLENNGYFTVDTSGNITMGAEPEYTFNTTDFDFKTNRIVNTATILDQLSKITVPSSARQIELAVQGKLVYTTDFTNDRFSVIDVTDVNIPTVIGSITDGDFTNLSAVCVAGNFAYVGGDTQFSVIDVSAPASPVKRGGVTLDSDGSCYVSGRYVYVTAFGNTFSVIDVSDPDNPEIVGTLTDASNFDALYRMFVRGNFAYVMDQSGDGSTEAGFHIIDISDPTQPTRIFSLIDSDLIVPTDITVNGKYAYLTNIGGASTNLAIVDISDPTSPFVVGSATAGSNNLFTLQITGNFAYVGGNVDGFTIFDVSVPATPVFLEQITGPFDTAAAFMRLAGRFIYAVDEDESFSIYDTSGIQVTNANIGSLDTTTLYISQNATVANNLYTAALNVGQGGILSNGDVSLANSTLITKTGLVGINVIDPVSPLHVFEDTTTVIGDTGLTIENAGTGDALLHYQIAATTWTTGIDNSNDDKFKISNNANLANSNALTILTNLDIGMGTVDPVSKLHIFENTSSTDETTGLTIEQDGTGDSLLQFLLTGGRRWVVGIDNSDSDKFKISSDVGLDSNARLTIDTSGQVAIRTNVPLNTFHVNVNSNTGIDSSAFSRGILVSQNSNPELVLENAGTGDVLRLNVGQDAQARFQSLSADGLTIDQNNMLVFDLDNGRVGIGTDNPNSGLQINNSLAVKRISTSAATYNENGDTIIGVDTNSNAVTVVLSTASLQDGRILTIKDEGGNAMSNNITIDPGTNTIDGSATDIILGVDFAVLRLYSDGSNWFTV